MARTTDAILDELLVLRCQDGDAEALSALVGRWHGRLTAHALRLTADRPAAEDAVQDAWLAIVARLGRLDDPARFGVWARRIVTHKCADWVRRRQRDRAARDAVARRGAGRDEPDGAASDPFVEEPMRAALRTLSDEHRAALGLHYVEGLSVGAIAAALDVPKGTVKSRLHHARRRLEEAWRAHEERTSP